jgi:hypothetical protein
MRLSPTTLPLQQALWFRPGHNALALCSEVFSNLVEEDSRMYTSIVLGVYLMANSAPEMAPESLSWQGDYGAAYRAGKREQKPLAIFVGRGPEGWQKVSQDGQLSPEARKLLAGHYVCLYADTTQGAGRRLAGSLEVGDGPGLVLSDRSLDAQAFHHEGKLSASDLEGRLRKYANPEHTVWSTENLATQEVRYYYPPAQPVAPAVVPFGGFGGLGGFGGGFGGGRGGC